MAKTSTPSIEIKFGAVEGWDTDSEVVCYLSNRSVAYDGLGAERAEGAMFLKRIYR